MVLDFVQTLTFWKKKIKKNQNIHISQITIKEKKTKNQNFKVYREKSRKIWWIESDRVTLFLFHRSPIQSYTTFTLFYIAEEEEEEEEEEKAVGAVWAFRYVGSSDGGRMPFVETGFCPTQCIDPGRQCEWTGVVRPGSPWHGKCCSPPHCGLVLSHSAPI